MFSLQLRKYEDLLADIKNQQIVILDKQQDQFKTLIDDCVLKQQITETNVRLQQERINNQIQMMISNSFGSKIELKGDGDSPKPKGDCEETLIQTMKQRHNEELFVMEESYKYVQFCFLFTVRGKIRDHFFEGQIPKQFDFGLQNNFVWHIYKLIE